MTHATEGAHRATAWLATALPFVSKFYLDKFLNSYLTFMPLLYLVRTYSVCYNKHVKQKERKWNMRTVTENAIKAFLNGKNCKLGGKQSQTGTQNTEIRDNVLYLHENAIAKLVNGELYVRFAGWGSVTTRERLHAFSEFGYKISVCQRNHQQIINGEVADLYKWYHIKRI